MTKHALVTGAAGFIGSHLTEKLVKDDWTVTAIDNLSPTYDTGRRRDVAQQMSKSRRVHFIEGNLLMVDLGDVIGGADAIFHLAARPGVRSSWDDFQWSIEANVLATQRLLYAMFRANPDARLVCASSSSVYGQAPEYPTKESDPLAPISPYGVSKVAAEQLVHAYVSQFDLDVVVLRYFTVYGPRQRSDMAFTRWIRATLDNQPVRLFGDGSVVRDFTYVGDVVDATIAALSVPADVYNVAGGSPTSLATAIDVIGAACDRQPDVTYLPQVAGDPNQTGGDTTRLRGASAWSANTSLEDGIAAQVDWIAGTS